MIRNTFRLIVRAFCSQIHDNRCCRFVAMLLLALSLLALPACNQQEPVEVVATPTTATNSVGPAPRPTIPARLKGQAALPALVSVGVVGSGDDVAGYQRPAYLAAELAGRDIANVSLIGGDVTEDGRRRVLIHRPVDPDLGDDEWPGEWRDGVHDLIQTWDFAGDFLWDGQNGDFTVLWTTDPQAETRIAHGQFRKAGEDNYRESVLEVDISNGLVTGVVETSTGSTLDHQAGDEFQLDRLILAEDGTLQSEPGASLVFDEGAQLTYASRPAPSGTYFLGLSAQSAAGAIDAGYATFAVDNDSLSPGYRAFFDPYRGFQLFYPEAWTSPADYVGPLTFGDPSGDFRLSVSTHPDMSGRPAVDLKNKALDVFGDVAVLYEDQVEIEQSGGLRTVYGYESESGARTGVLLTFSQGGQAFVVDIDGPAEREQAAVELAGVVASSWLSRPLEAAAGGRWTEAQIDGLSVKVPAAYRYTRMSNDWHRFASEDDLVFLAFRGEPVAGSGLLNRMDHWAGVAGRNASDFAVSDAYLLERGGRGWARIDFEYTSPDAGRLAGAVMVTRAGDRYVVYWAEAPAGHYKRLEEELFLVVVDELSNRLPPETGADPPS